MKLVILHLSDIHIKDEFDQILNQDLNIARSTYKHIDNNDHVVILISGDIAFSGQKEQYNLANILFTKIESHIKNERKVNINFIICPGNHDCDFTKNPTRDFMLQNMLKQNLSELDPTVFESCTTHQEQYFQFKDCLEGTSIEEDKLWVTNKINIGNKSIVFESINLSWASTLKETQGKLLFPFSSYANKSKIDADLRISLMHHPLNWLNQSSYRELRTSLRSISDFIFTGHEHANNAINHNDIESGETIIIEGGSLQEDTINNSSFGIITIDIISNNHNFYSYKYCSTSEYYIPQEEKKLIINKRNNKENFSFNESFKDKLNDCGGYFKHSNSINLKLADVFVYPNIKKESSSSQQKNSLSAKELLDVNKFTKGVILSGEDNIGATSLLYSLISEYSINGFIPVLLKGSDIKQKHKRNLDIQIERALKEQYLNERIVVNFEQEPTSKKVLFIDDFEDLKIKSTSAINEALAYLMGKFEKIILTVDSMYEVNEITSIEEKATTRLFDHYKIQQFGYQKRTELINKWYTVGQQDVESESQVIGKCNVAERLMDTVMDKSLISPNPIFLLTFLQSIETGQSTQLSDSALGHYYHFLLSESFLDVGVGAESLGKELDYAMHLARFFNQKETLTITYQEFKEFNDYFSKTWDETNFERKESILIRAKVLIKNGSDYEFRYLYNYYYLLGRYLSLNILNEGINAEINNYIKHLYVKKNANTILFLAHHSSSDNILVMMKEAADELFKENAAADFNGGCSVVQELIKDAPTLEFNHKSPQENRKKHSERRDYSENKKTTTLEQEKECDLENLNLATKITMLFKTIDILSQIIKSAPTQFQRPKKVEIIKSVYLAPLRALQDFYNFLEENPRALIETINNELEKKSSKLLDSERDAIARLAVSQLIQSVSSGFIIKTAEVLNSEALMPDIPPAIGHSPTLAIDLIGLSICLDNHKPLERRKIKSIYTRCEKNSVATKILDLLIMNRLHMFKTSEQDMQWLQSELKYDLSQQHGIAYNRKNKVARLSNK